MNDRMPDFEPPAPMFEEPAVKKPRKKPMRRTKRKKKMLVTPPIPKRRIVKKKSFKVRRGRPPGVPNKPKTAIPQGGQAPSSAVYALLAALIEMPKIDRDQAIAEIGKLFR